MSDMLIPPRECQASDWARLLRLYRSGRYLPAANDPDYSYQHYRRSDVSALQILLGTVGVALLILAPLWVFGVALPWLMQWAQS